MNQLQKARAFAAKNLAPVAALGTAAVTAVMNPAHAAITIDTSEITGDIGTVATAVGVIGVAIVGVTLAIVAYKWIRSSLR